MVRYLRNLVSLRSAGQHDQLVLVCIIYFRELCKIIIGTVLADNKLYSNFPSVYYKDTYYIGEYNSILIVYSSNL